MRLSANILQSAEQRTDPLGSREIHLRSLAIPNIEHLSVTRDQFDTIDLSNNHLTRLENFPKLTRLSCLYLGGNGITQVDGKNLKKNLPGLTTLVLSGNGVKGWNVICELGAGCPGMDFLSLVGNPVTRRQYYRLYTIHKISTLKVLDFQKVKQSERERARRLASSAAGAAMEADARLEGRAVSAASSSESTNDTAFFSSTYANGENETKGKSAEELFATQFTMQEKSKIREMIANAVRAEEIDRIESLMKRGIFPGTSEPAKSGCSIIPPSSPTAEINEGEEKRPADIEKGSASKRQKSE